LSEGRRDFAVVGRRPVKISNGSGPSSVVMFAAANRRRSYRKLTPAPFVLRRRPDCAATPVSRRQVAIPKSVIRIVAAPSIITLAGFRFRDGAAALVRRRDPGAQLAREIDRRVHEGCGLSRRSSDRSDYSPSNCHREESGRRRPARSARGGRRSCATLTAPRAARCELRQPAVWRPRRRAVGISAATG